MANYMQTNHNGRVNAKTGKAYSRKHNDRQYDVTKVENINEVLVTQLHTPIPISTHIHTHTHSIRKTFFFLVS